MILRAIPLRRVGVVSGVGNIALGGYVQPSPSCGPISAESRHFVPNSRWQPSIQNGEACSDAFGPTRGERAETYPPNGNIPNTETTPNSS